MFKQVSKFTKFFFRLNIVMVVLLFLACITPHLTNENFSFLTFISLSVPALVLINLLFVIYWILLKKIKFILPSLVVLFIGYFALGTFYKFNFFEAEPAADDLKVMSFNVRYFNKFRNIESETVFEDTQSFIATEDPDIICFQEPDYLKRNEFKKYPHFFLKYIDTYGRGLLGIYSKYPIINKGMIAFPKTHSNASFADIVYKNDTIRVYNVHLESLGITPGNRTLRKKRSDKVVRMLNSAFKKQQEQAEILEKHITASPYKTLLCGDFNNNQFSNIYKTIKGDFQDTFIEQGSGYGRTLYFHRIPVRIDFILADKSFEVTSHKNYDVKFSDHYPVMASFKLSAN